jgi:hypothetical protein
MLMEEGLRCRLCVGGMAFLGIGGGIEVDYGFYVDSLFGRVGCRGTKLKLKLFTTIPELSGCSLCPPPDNLDCA